jgi:hypothetical protein
MDDQEQNIRRATRARGREVEVGPNGDVREAADEANESPRPTTISPHTWGER